MKMKLLFSKLMLILALVLSFKNIAAQEYSVELKDSNLVGGLGSEIIFDFVITNTSTDTLTIYFVRANNELPNGWSSSLCFDRCFAQHIDSIVTNYDFGNSPIPPDSSRDISVHVFPAELEGQGNIKIKIANINKPSESLEYDLIVGTTIVSVEKNNFIVNNYELLQNYPNPFNPSTNISFSIEKSGNVNLTVYDILGTKIKTLTNKQYSKGNYNIKFNANNLASGIYFYSLSVNNSIITKKMIIGK